MLLISTRSITNENTFRRFSALFMISRWMLLSSQCVYLSRPNPSPDNHGQTVFIRQIICLTVWWQYLSLFWEAQSVFLQAKTNPTSVITEQMQWNKLVVSTLGEKNNHALWKSWYIPPTTWLEYSMFLVQCSFYTHTELTQVVDNVHDVSFIIKV